MLFCLGMLYGAQRNRHGEHDSVCIHENMFRLIPSVLVVISVKFCKSVSSAVCSDAAI